MRNCFLSLVLLGLAACPQISQAGEGAQYLPETTVIYAEVDQPAKAIRQVRSHDVLKAVTARFQELPAVAQVYQDQKVAQLQAVLTILESEWGRKWPEALAALTKNGVCFGFDGSTEGAILLLHAESEQAIEEIVLTTVKLAEQDARDKGNDPPFEIDEYREAKVYRAKDMGFAILDDWLLVANNGDVARGVIDAMLDSREDSLAEQEHFQHASKNR